jgi:ABC-type cobalamin/Fe3+-siderophores transport system ATPase subunit
MSLQIQNLTLKYPGSSNFVFQDLSFELKEPGFNSLFGPSGVGKTSLAKILTGDMRHFSGEVTHEEMKTFFILTIQSACPAGRVSENTSRRSLRPEDRNAGKN